MARVAVLLGGLSPERPGSLVSGKGCADALRRLGHDVIEIDPQNEGWIAELQDVRPDVVFNALHGEYGEDGRTQGVLDYLKLPYTHSGTLASALPVGEVTDVEFWHVDQSVRVIVGGREVVYAEYDWTPRERILHATGRPLDTLLENQESAWDAVAALLIHEAVGDQLTCILVDHGLMRKNEAADVVAMFRQHFNPFIYRLGVTVQADDATIDASPVVADARASADAVRRVVRSAVELGVSYLTLFGFSSENWQRPVTEVADLMTLLRFYLEREVAELGRECKGACCYRHKHAICPE